MAHPTSYLADDHKYENCMSTKAIALSDFH